MPTILRRFASPLIVVVIISVVTGMALLSSAQAAAEVESITLSPVSKDYQVKVGDVLHDSITVLNDGDTAYDFTVYATPYSVSNENYDPSFTETSQRADAYTWVQFEKTTYHAEPRQTLDIPFTIQVKGDAIPGGHYGAIFVETKPADGQQLARKKRVGAIVYATVSGDVIRKGEVKSVTIPWFQSTPPLAISAEVTNTGNTDFQATAAYEVKDVFGRTVYKVEQAYAVLPETTRRIDMEWAHASWFGVYRVNASVGVLDSTKAAASYVIIIPTWMIILILLALFGGGVNAFVRRTRRHSK